MKKIKLKSAGIDFFAECKRNILISVNAKKLKRVKVWKLYSES